ncbi:DUF1398 family protein [Geothrix oryzae]|uniref:DUF1398 family protein n=1 Tax=Geothrix oryzae TaxID=2927975 RepID=UPI002572F52C|nr:DUF1398 family protein [Geothrix oryzae]
MDANKVLKAAQATLTGSMPFPEIVARLIGNGVEYYYVDYASRLFTFYSTEGAVVQAPLSFEDLPAISEDFDKASLRAAIVDSQQHGQKFRDFSKRAVAAGVQGYFAFLRGQRVTYFGRQGDQHTEWFPGAKPSDA